MAIEKLKSFRENSWKMSWNIEEKDEMRPYIDIHPSESRMNLI